MHEIPKGPIIPEVPRQKHSFAFLKEPIGSYRLCFVRSFARRINEEIQKTITVHNMFETVVFIPNRSTPFQRPLRYLIHPNKRLKLSSVQDGPFIASRGRLNEKWLFVYVLSVRGNHKAFKSDTTDYVKITGLTLCDQSQFRTQSPQALWPAVGRQKRPTPGDQPLAKEPEDSGYETGPHRHESGTRKPPL